MAALLIVGAGLTGATLARLAADCGISVKVVERRDGVGGNCRDWIHPESGWRINHHGPHYFRTSSDAIRDFVLRFTELTRFEATVGAAIGQEIVTWPPSRRWLEDRYGQTIQRTRNPGNFAEACLSVMPAGAYRDFVAGYSEKQWGVKPESLSVELARRIEIRDYQEPRLKTSKYQGLPARGYDAMVWKMLAGIEVVIGQDGRYGRNGELTVYTGPIDEYFEYDLGRLRYRGQRREHLWIEGGAPRFPTTQVNYPSLVAGPHVRDIEWTHMPIDKPCAGTLITRETPFTPTDPDDYEYPFLAAEDRMLYERYAERAAAFLPDVIFAGRLGTYKYLDMDQAIGAAMKLFRTRILPRLSQ